MADAFAELTPEERRRALAALRRAPPETRQRLAPDEAAPGAEEAPPATLRELREERRERRRERRERLRETIRQP